MSCLRNECCDDDDDDDESNNEGEKQQKEVTPALGDESDDEAKAFNKTGISFERAVLNQYNAPIIITLMYSPADPLGQSERQRTRANR